MPTATLSHSLLPLFSFFLSFSIFILFLLSLWHKTHKVRSPNAEKPPPCQTKPLLTSVASSTEEEEPTKEEDKKRRKRGRKKRQEPTLSESGDESKETKSTVQIGDGEVVTVVSGTGSDKRTAGTNYPSFPFSSITSSLQRRIKSKYDEILRSANQSSALTIVQVSDFIDCLVEARNELQHRSEQVQRSFKIKKALLSTANKSFYDRLCDEVYKLEKEHKRLEAGAAVYNLLQEQLKLSPAYKTLLDLSAKMEQKSQKEQLTDIPDISFEELLAQEKKDSFWQKNRKKRSTAK